MENDFYFPSYPELQAFLQGTHSLPAKSVVLTFDDAEQGFLDVGIPILEKYQVPATSFVICSDENAAQKVVDYRSPYVSFQSHSFGLHQAGGTVGHGGLISALTKDEIVEDLEHAQQVVGATEAFAYPFGDVTADGQQAVREAGDPLCVHHAELLGPRRRRRLALPRAHLGRVRARGLRLARERLNRPR